MNTAIELVKSIFNKCVSFVFNDMIIHDGVSVGWVMIACLVFGLLISSILNLPHHMGNFSRFDDKQIYSYDYKTGHSSIKRISRRRV